MLCLYSRGEGEVVEMLKDMGKDDEKAQALYDTVVKTNPEDEPKLSY